jgi:hypothetical protein
MHVGGLQHHLLLGLSARAERGNAEGEGARER